MTDTLDEAIQISDFSWRCAEAVEAAQIAAHMTIARELRRIAVSLCWLADDHVISALGQCHD